MSDLLTAIQAVKNKITVSAGTASPEELAYLGTALDRIGGRATVYEVVEVGDAKKAELTALAEQLASAINTDTTEELAAFVAAVDAKIAAMTSSANTLVDTSIQNITDTKDAAEAYITDTKDAAEAYITDVKNAATDYASTTLTQTTAAIDASKNTALDAVMDAKNAAVLTVDEAAAELSSAAAIAQQQALNGSMFVNYYFATL